jgi:hypothetical protein
MNSKPLAKDRLSEAPQIEANFTHQTPMNTPISDEDLGKKVREMAAACECTPDIFLELAKSAAEHQRWSVMPNIGPYPEVINEKELEESDLAEWPEWISPLIRPGCRLENLEWPDGTISLRILSPRGRVVAACRVTE